MRYFISLLIILTFPFLFLFTPAGEFCFKEVVYRVLVREIIQDCETDYQKITAIMDWTHSHIYQGTREGYSIIDKDALTTIVREMGFCDQQSMVLLTLCRKIGIKGELIFLLNEEGVSNHTVARIKDIYFDTYKNCIMADMGKHRVFLKTGQKGLRKCLATMMDCYWWVFRKGFVWCYTELYLMGKDEDYRTSIRQLIWEEGR